MKGVRDHILKAQLKALNYTLLLLLLLLFIIIIIIEATLIFTYL